jgi:hypothetical protein
MNKMSVERVWSELAPILMPARDNAVGWTASLSTR